MKVLIVDDEPLARARVARMLEKAGNLQIVGEAEDGYSALRQVEKLQPDVVLLDIRMPGMDGLETATHLQKLHNPPAVIFCTAYGEHALEAFQASAAGYIVKPVKQEDLEQALAQAKRINRAQLQQLADSAQALDAEHGIKQARHHISARTRNGLELIPIGDIRCFQADHKYVTLYHTRGELLIDDTLKELEDEFAGRFVRIHRNALVSLKHVEGMERTPQGFYCLRLQGLEMKPIVSRRHVTDIRSLLKSL